VADRRTGVGVEAENLGGGFSSVAVVNVACTRWVISVMLLRRGAGLATGKKLWQTKMAGSRRPSRSACDAGRGWQSSLCV